VQSKLSRKERAEIEGRSVWIIWMEDFRPLAVIGLLGVVVKFFQENVTLVFRAFAAVLGLPWAHIVAFILVVGTGLLAHWFKDKNQLWYGIVEVAVGVGSAATVVFSLKVTGAMFPQWTALVGCAYVIARGLNNISEGYKKAIAELNAIPPWEVSLDG